MCLMKPNEMRFGMPHYKTKIQCDNDEKHRRPHANTYFNCQINIFTNHIIMLIDLDAE